MGEFTKSTIGNFVFGMHQVAYDGEKVITTPAYDADAKNKRIALKKSTGSSLEELLRIRKKYQDWELCPESKKLLNPPVPYSRWADHHGFIG